MPDEELANCATFLAVHCLAEPFGELRGVRPEGLQRRVVGEQVDLLAIGQAIRRAAVDEFAALHELDRIVAHHHRAVAIGIGQELLLRGFRSEEERAATVHGERGYASLADIPFDVDVVDVFRRADAAGAVADEALRRPEVKGVWFQLGVVDAAAAERVLAAGRVMVMDRCPAIEWPRLLG